MCNWWKRINLIAGGGRDPKEYTYEIKWNESGAVHHEKFGLNKWSKDEYSVGKPDALSLWAESNTKSAREKQGARRKEMNATFNQTNYLLSSVFDCENEGASCDGLVNQKNIFQIWNRI